MILKVWCVGVVTLCLAASAFSDLPGHPDHSSAAATEGDDVIDQLFQSEIDIYNLGKLDENRGSRSLLPGDNGHHHGHGHGHEGEHHHEEHHADGHEHDAHHDHEEVSQEHQIADAGRVSPDSGFQQRRAPADGLGLAAGSTQSAASPRVATSAAVVPVQEAAPVQQPSGGLGVAQQPRSGRRLQAGSGANLNGNGLDIDGNQPRSYQFEYKVSDDKEQVYQKHTQNSNNQVVSGEYSWVDPFGTLHIIRYRADDTGYHILDNIEKANFVEIVPHEPVKKQVRKVRKLVRPRLADPRRPTVFRTSPVQNSIDNEADSIDNSASQIIQETQRSQSAGVRQQQNISPASTIKLSNAAAAINNLPSPAPSIVRLSQTAAPIIVSSAVPVAPLIAASPTPSVQLLASPAPVSPPSPQPAAFVRLRQNPSPRPSAVLLSSIPSNSPRPALVNKIKGPLRRIRLRHPKRPQILSAIPLETQRNEADQQNSNDSSETNISQKTVNPAEIQTASVQVPIFSLQNNIQPITLNNAPAPSVTPIRLSRPTVLISRPNFIQPASIQRVPAPIASPVPIANPVIAPVPFTRPVAAPVPLRPVTLKASLDPIVSSNVQTLNTVAPKVIQPSAVPLLPALPAPPAPNSIPTVSNNEKKPFQAHPDPDLTKRIFGGSGKVIFNAPSHNYEYRA